MSPKQTCDAKIAHTTISYDPYQTRATHTQEKTSAQSSRPAHPTFPRRANNMNNHQTLTPAPREHDSAPPPLPHDPKHNATHIDLRTTWKHTALPAPRNILQAPNATQRRTVIRRSPNTSRTGPSVREHHAKLPRIMASARPSSLTSPRPAQSQHNATQQTNTRHRPNQTHLCFHHACATTLSTILRRNADSASRHLQRPNYAYANISVSSIHYAHDNTYSDTINYAPTII
jgi:hypothetical protein